MSGTEESDRTIVIASRKSKLALVQSQLVLDELQRLHPKMQFKIETYQTKGDRILDVSLNKIGDKGLFTKELENALLDRRADIAVHSLKDMPSKLPDGLRIGAISKRENSTDAVVIHPRHEGKTLATLPDGSTIGTSSLRRVAQLSRKFPNYKFRSVRGNLQTRLAKLDDYDTNHYDALILATSGLERMGLTDRITERISKSICLPAVGQGALAIECREDDTFILEILDAISHKETTLCCSAERQFMKILEGGCQVPIGVNTELQGEKLIIRGIVLSLDGSECVEGEMISEQCTVENAIAIGEELAKDLKNKGADKILQEIFNSTS